MYMVHRVKDIIRIPPERFGEPLQNVATEVLMEKYMGLYDKEMGIVIGVYDVNVSPFGRILPNDGASYHEAEFSVISYKPALHEVVEAPVVDVKEFGLFVRLGPVDGFIHKSQVSDEYVEYDPTRPGFILKDSRKIIERGNIVRARIVAVSLSPEREELRIQLTMRQPYLGKIEKRR